MRRIVFIAAMCVVAVAACDSGPRPEPVVVYASFADETYLPELFSGFTKATGIPVTLKYDDSGTNTLNVINDEGSPPADVLLTNNVADVWRAAEQGALRPIASERTKSLPANLQDPDGFWVAFDFRLIVIAVAPQERDAPTPTTYSDLAKPAYRDRVCLSSSLLAENRATIAMLIDSLGARPAEIVVRGWVQNLALPPFKHEQQLIAAIQSGSCQYGILADAAAVAIETRVPPDAFVTIDGIGIARHARYPESAQRLLDWVLAEKALAMPPTASIRNVAVAGAGDDDARLLAERAQYR